MRLRIIARALLATFVVVAAPAAGFAQGDGGGFQVPGNSFPTIPIPTGGGPNSGGAGFYTAVEFLYLTQTRAIGDQTVAYRGLVDSSGRITGLPGIYLGSQQVALTTDKLGRTNFFPGFNIEVGYKFDDGTKLYASYMQLFQSNYTDGATLAAPYARSNKALDDTYLVSGVYNFSPQFAGPRQKTTYDFSPTQFPATLAIQPGPFLFTGARGGILFTNVPVELQTPVIFNIPNEVAQNPASPYYNPGFNTYGIWNGAAVMDIKFSERFTEAEIGMRTPLFQTDYSRTYGLAGGKYAWFFERFTWLTVDYDLNGNSAPFYQATYTNTLSQRLYGPFIGCGQELYLGNAFSASLDLTGAALLGIVKERAKYELNDESTQSKRGWNTFNVVPNLNGNFNLWWYPTEGVQIRLGYQAQTYYATKYMREPVGFDFSAPEGTIDTKWFRVIHGVNVGLGLFF